MLVLDRLRLGDAVAARGVALERLEIRDKNGRVLQAIDLGRVRARFGRTTVSILRADLQAVLAGALRSGTLHLGKRCTGVRTGEHEAVALFEDGSEAAGDVLIGADGLRSVVREAVVPGVRLRYAGQTCYLGVADLELPPGLARTVWEVWGGAHRFGFSAVAEDRVYWFAPVTALEGNPVTANSASDRGKALLHNAYNSFPSPIPNIIRHTAAENIIRVNLYDFAPIKRWSRGRVVLVGDAAHAMTPNLGQGGAQATEDAFVLADALEQEATVEAAFSTYTRLRQPKAARIVHTAWWLGKVAHLEAPWLRGARNLALRSTPARVGQERAEALYKLNH